MPRREWATGAGWRPGGPALAAAVRLSLDTGSRDRRLGKGPVMMADSRRNQVMAACGAKPGSAEDYPFGDEVAVFKVAGRMFALVSLGPAPGNVSLKCDPGLATELRGRYAAIIPGYHLNKRHWNTVTLDGSVPDEEVLELIDHSYDLVLAGLTRTQRNKLII